MKRIIVLLSSLVIVLSHTACGDAQNVAVLKNENSAIETTNAIVDDLVVVTEPIEEVHEYTYKFISNEDGKRQRTYWKRLSSKSFSR